MDKLSSRAQRFLNSLNREAKNLSEAQINETFLNAGLQNYDALLNFELNYSGYIFYAGLEPIKFKLIEGGGYPFNSKMAIIDFEESETDDHKFDFYIAETNYQMRFTIDEDGRYYEEFDLMHSSFEKFLESHAIWDFCKNNKNYELVFRNKPSTEENVETMFNLNLLESASDDYTKWFHNEELFLQRHNDNLTLIGLKDSIIAEEIKNYVANST